MSPGQKTFLNEMYQSETAETDADESYQEATDTDEEWVSVGEAVIMPPLILNR